MLGLVLAGPYTSLGQQDEDATLSAAKEATHGPVYIAEVQAGFSEGGRNLVRPDYFAPVRVSLVNRTPEIFTGTVQIIGRDRDGETVIYERPGIGIKPADSASIVMSWFARNTSGSMTTTDGVMVRLLDRDGKLVHAVESQVDFAADNQTLIVDLSPQTIKGRIQVVFTDDPKEGLIYRQQVRTATMRPADLPAHWYDLEAVDVLVCDAPEESKLGVDQWNTLAKWVRQGGLLVLGPGSMQSLAKTDLAKELPAAALTMARITPEDFKAPMRPSAGPEAEEVAPEELADRAQAIGIERSSLTFNWLKDMGVWQLSPRPDATTILTLPLKRGSWPIIVRRRVGFGSIVQTGIPLATLLSPQAVEGIKPGMGTQIKAEIFGIRELDPPGEDVNVRKDMSGSMLWPNQYGSADLLKGDADFRAAGTVLATILLVLTIVYGLLATLGTWLVLRRRKLTHYAWLAFGLVAVIGSAGAAFLVQGARGIRGEVKQRSIVDVEGASGMASVHTFYGLRVPYDSRVNVGLTTAHAQELPPEQAKEAYIRPASNLSIEAMDGFAVRRDYTIRYGQTELTNVPIRATAKQFESYWYGPLRGTIQGVIAPQGDGRQLSNRSWISNQTDMNLRECRLVFSSRPALVNPKTRNAFITILRVGDLPAKRVRSDLNDLAGSLPPQGAAGWAHDLDSVGKAWLRWRGWNSGMQSGYGSDEKPLPIDRSDATASMTATMVSLFCDLPSDTHADPWGGGQTVIVPQSNLPRSGGRWLDLRYVLDGKGALLIGLTDDPGPSRLEVNGRAMEPTTGSCIVRAIVPLTGG